MTKGSKDLRRLSYENACCRCQYWKRNKCTNNHGECNWQDIEKELQDYENLKLKHKSMQDAVLGNFKELKVLEIIKKYCEFYFIEKTINEKTKWEIDIRPKDIFAFLAIHPKTKEEFDLLKEVLTDD